MAEINDLQIRLLVELKNKFNTEVVTDESVFRDGITLFLYQHFFSAYSQELDLFEIIDNVQYYILQNMNEAFTGEKAIDVLFEYANTLSESDFIKELTPITQKNYLELITAGIKFLSGFGFGDEIADDERIDWQLDLYNQANKKLNPNGYKISLELCAITTNN